jgi:hypothetical protein
MPHSHTAQSHTRKGWELLPACDRISWSTEFLQVTELHHAITGSSKTPGCPLVNPGFKKLWISPGHSTSFLNLSQLHLTMLACIRRAACQIRSTLSTHLQLCCPLVPKQCVRLPHFHALRCAGPPGPRSALGLPVRRAS